MNPSVKFLAIIVLGISFGAAVALARVAPTTRPQAVATVRAILRSNATACKIDRVQSISAVRSGAVWKVTARLVMSGSGRRLTETAAWNVRVADGHAAPANELASEIENGCPLD